MEFKINNGIYGFLCKEKASSRRRIILNRNLISTVKAQRPKTFLMSFAMQHSVGSSNFKKMQKEWRNVYRYSLHCDSQLLCARVSVLFLEIGFRKIAKAINEIVRAKYFILMNIIGIFSCDFVGLLGFLPTPTNSNTTIKLVLATRER